MLLIMLGLCTACSQSNSDKLKALKPPSSERLSLSKSYSNVSYDVAMRVPENWIIMEEPHLKVGEFAISIFKEGTGAEKELPLGVHSKPIHSYVALWPKGIGTELPYGQSVSFNESQHVPELSFKINPQKSKILQLKDGAAWAYFIAPANPPDNWSPQGFIYAQIQGTELSASCFDRQTGKKKPLRSCDVLAGDKYVRKGHVNKKDAQAVHKILKTLSLKNINPKKMAGDFIKIDQPHANTDITSPLTIKGKAVGNWYFEGRFPVELYDTQGNKIAEKPAKAEDMWMTENAVSFSVTLTFHVPENKRGKLIFRKANPSGKPENDSTYILPVYFSPK